MRQAILVPQTRFMTKSCIQQYKSSVYDKYYVCKQQNNDFILNHLNQTEM